MTRDVVHDVMVIGARCTFESFPCTIAFGISKTAEHYRSGASSRGRRLAAASCEVMDGRS